MDQDHDVEIDESLVDPESPLDATDDIEVMRPGDEPVDEADWLEQHQPVGGDDEDYSRAGD